MIYAKFLDLYYPVDSFDERKLIIRANTSIVMVDYPGAVSEVEMSWRTTPTTEDGQMADAVRERIRKRIEKEERELNRVFQRLKVLKRFQETIS